MINLLQVGGLGDVVTSLSRAVQDLNHSVDIILPKYDCLKVNHVSSLQPPHIEDFVLFILRVFFVLPLVLHLSINRDC